MRLTDRVAIVTGGAQGIGRGYALGLAAEGARVVVADLNKEGADRVAAEILTAGGDAIAVQVDIADETSALAMAEHAASAFGSVDILINNAALFSQMERHSLLSIPLDYWNRFMSINLTGALLCSRAVVPYMRLRARGKIVNQSSGAAYMGAGNYGIAKAGVNALTIALARELGPLNIHVNAIAPGPTETEGMRITTPPQILEAILAETPIHRVGSVQDMVNAALFLVSDESNWITGQILVVDGGHLRRI